MTQVGMMLLLGFGVLWALIWCVLLERRAGAQNKRLDALNLCMDGVVEQLKKSLSDWARLAGERTQDLARPHGPVKPSTAADGRHHPPSRKLLVWVVGYRDRDRPDNYDEVAVAAATATRAVEVFNARRGEQCVLISVNVATNRDGQPVDRFYVLIDEAN